MVNYTSQLTLLQSAWIIYSGYWCWKTNQTVTHCFSYYQFRTNSALNIFTWKLFMLKYFHLLGQPTKIFNNKLIWRLKFFAWLTKLVGTCGYLLSLLGLSEPIVDASWTHKSYILQTVLDDCSATSHPIPFSPHYPSRQSLNLLAWISPHLKNHLKMLKIQPAVS